MRPLRLACVLACALACSRDDRDPTPAPPPPPPAPRDAGIVAWRVSVESHYGPCPPDDRRPCHHSWSVTHDGTFVYDAPPNQDGGPHAHGTSKLGRDELATLAELIASREFRDGIAHGFPCEGGRDHDATLSLCIQSAAVTGCQQVEMCERFGKRDLLVNRVLHLVRR